MKRCPACRSGNVRRSTIRGTEHGRHALRSPYRCKDCNARFWVFSRNARIGAVAAGAGLLTAVLLAGGASLMIEYQPRLSDAEIEAASMPDQQVNETRRLDVRSTAAPPEVNSLPAGR